MRIRAERTDRRGDRATYESFMVNPWLDWQVTDEWLLKFGAGMMFSSRDFTMQEPYNGRRDELLGYYETGEWYSGNKYMTSGFSEADSVSRKYNLFSLSRRHTGARPRSTAS